MATAMETRNASTGLTWGIAPVLPATRPPVRVRGRSRQVLQTERCEISYSFCSPTTVTVRGSLRPLGGGLTLSPHGHLHELDLSVHLGSLTADPPARPTRIVHRVVNSAGGEVVSLRSRRVCATRGSWYAIDGELQLAHGGAVPVQLAARLVRAPACTLVLLEGAADAASGSGRPGTVRVSVTAEFRP